MDDETDLVGQVAADVLGRTCTPEVVAAAEGTWAPAVWTALEETELTRVGVAEERGGPGGGWAEAAGLLRASGRFAAPIPVAETSVLGGWLLAEAGLDVPPGPLAVAVGDWIEIHSGGVYGEASRVAFARQAAHIVVLGRGTDGPLVALIDPGDCRIDAGLSMAREPRDRVRFEGAKHTLHAAAAPRAAERLAQRGALARAIQMAGALDRVLELTVAHVRVREQFGKPLAHLQAVQQEIAKLAGEVSAAGAAVDAAVAASEDAGAVAAAKIRAGIAAAEGARIAHQLHGAIGVTHEHQLHHFTSRLWAWRDEYGGEREWARRLGRLVAGLGPDRYWEWLTTQ